MSDLRVTPMHGKLTHPLTDAAVEALHRIAQAHRPRQEVNPGVVNRLLREALVEQVDLPTPYKTRTGTCPYLRITAAGQAALATRPLCDVPCPRRAHPDYGRPCPADCPRRA